MHYTNITVPNFQFGRAALHVKPDLEVFFFWQRRVEVFSEEGQLKEGEVCTRSCKLTAEKNHNKELKIDYILIRTFLVAK